MPYVVTIRHGLCFIEKQDGTFEHHGPSAFMRRIPMPELPVFPLEAIHDAEELADSLTMREDGLTLHQTVEWKRDVMARYRASHGGQEA